MDVSTIAENEVEESIESLPHIIYTNLRARILEGTLAPGQVLRQEELAAQFGVSRVPLREAMTRLEAGGLLILRPRRGYAVTSLDPHEISEIFELRGIIEEHGGYIATLARRDDDIEALEEILTTMEGLTTDTQEYFSEWSRCNRAFHTRLFATSRRKHVNRIADMLRDTVQPYIRIEVSMTGDLVAAEGEHREIFEAFVKGDARLVAHLSRAHCESTAQRLMDALRAKKKPGNAKSAASV